MFVQRRRTFGPIAWFSTIGLISAVSIALSVVMHDDDSGDSVAPSSEPLAPGTEPSFGDLRTPADDSVCRLLAFAGVADPSLQRAAARSPEDIDAVADVQREALIAAARLLGPGPDADVLSSLARVFVDPGTWSDRRWAEALVDRASPDRMATLERLETDCAARDEIEG